MCEDSCMELCFSRVPNRSLQGCLLPKVTVTNVDTTLCTGAAAFDAPHHPPSKPSLPLRTLDDTTPTPTPTPFTLRNTASAFISLVTTTLLPPKNCNRSHIDPTTRLLILRRAHTHATCALPRQQHRPPWGAKLAIHHHPPFLRWIARL